MTTNSPASKPAMAGDSKRPDAGGPAPSGPPVPDGSEHRRALWVAASELIVDLGYASRAHLITGQRMRARVKWIAIPREILPVVASAGAATLALFGLSDWAVAFGFGGALAVALDKSIDPIGQANAHSDKGDRLLSVCKDVRYFRNVRLSGETSAAEFQHELAQLRRRADDVRMLAPHQLPEYAYSEAQRQVADGQAEYVGDPLWQDPPDDL